MIESILNRRAGFFSMLFFTINHYLYCRDHQQSFRLCTQHWLFRHEKGWLDYFESIDYDSPKDSGRLVRVSDTQTLGDYTIKEYANILPDFYRLNNKLTEKASRTKVMLGLTDGTYDAIFTRRGDKLVGECDYIHASQYLEALLRIHTEVKTIFVQTDDFNVVLELHEAIKNANLTIKVVTLCPEDRRGFVIFNCHKSCVAQGSVKQQNQAYVKLNAEEIAKGKTVEEMNPDEIRDHTEAMLVGIEIVRASAHCALDYSSNVGRFIKLYHENAEQVVSVDNLALDWNKKICPAYAF